MKNLSWFNKTAFFFNIILAILTIVGYILPFLAPKLFPILSVLTLFLPMLLIVNVLFFGYWIIQFKKQLLVSGIILLCGITFINKFYKFSEKNVPLSESDFKIMSYNVRLFNKFEWSEKQTIPVEISDFIKESDPEILCVQEYSNTKDFDYKKYKYHYISINTSHKIKTGQAIFSKFPIIKKGDIEFPNSSNNAIFVDLVRKKDTIRVYCMHLQSIKISPDVSDISEDINEINQKKSERIFKRISKAFSIQQLQAEIVNKHKNTSKHPIILCGDMNNSAFSYVYRTIKGDLQDSFEEAGQGFGKSYDFDYYPARIDYIFADKALQIKSFHNYIDVMDSDHFPIMARIATQD